MKRIFPVILVFCFFINSNVKSYPKANNPFCRVTCTINVPDGFGGSYGFSGTAGNIFTSCETAMEKACKEATRNAFEIMMDLMEF
ncbi:hypothetical protein [Rufibacter sp. LB8]|uniref:hypothetical protein n=1 Tax=Rufibacter sp. LB8 TaxID=2777781 RepID=UPI00178C427E|nr:hypothetical protein [Rufibacter sp. LB8]